jgi:hypothetical protein
MRWAMAVMLACQSVVVAASPYPPIVSEQIFKDFSNLPSARPRKIEVPDGLIRSVNLSPDGRTDWLIDYSKAKTGNWCVAAGCRQLIFVSRKDGTLQKAFDAPVLHLRFATRKGEPRIDVEARGGTCGAAITTLCSESFAWNEALGLLVERPNAAGKTLIYKGGLSPVENEVLTAPATIRAVARTLETMCPTGPGGDPKMGIVTANGFPDINGDGIRDWRLDAPPPCGMDEAASYRIYVSRSDGSFAEAWDGAAGHQPDIDIATQPARVFDHADCQRERNCLRQPLTWDAAAARLVAR